MSVNGYISEQKEGDPTKLPRRGYRDIKGKKPLCKKIHNNDGYTERAKIECFRVEVRLCKLTAFLNICIRKAFGPLCFVSSGGSFVVDVGMFV